MYYIDCKEVEAKPFVMTSSSGIKTLSIIGKRNQTTFMFDEVFNVSMWCTKSINYVGIVKSYLAVTIMLAHCLIPDQPIELHIIWHVSEI